MSAIASVVMGYEIGGRKGANTFLLQTQSLDDIDVAEAAQSCFVYWTDRVMPQINDYVVLTNARVRDLDGSALADYSGSSPGGVNAAGATPNVAYLVKLGLAGTTRGGRFFLPGVTEAAVDELGFLLSEYVSGITTAVEDFIEDLKQVGEPQLMDMYKPSNGGYRLVTSVACDGKVSTMRRRLR